MTWPTDHGIRQTPSLAGRVSETTPVTWTAGVESVLEEARITSQERLGGRGASESELAALARYIDFTREVDHPHKGARSPEVLRGEAIFTRAEVGCSGCHSGERFTDRSSWALYGLEAVDTPSLTGIAATAPYLHDGRASTLREVLESAARREMGDASMLTAEQLDDLEAYLRSL
jgi:cytochrome c peroxidase